MLVSRDSKRSGDPFAVPDSMIDVRAIIEGMVPSAQTPAQRAQALVALEEPITRAAVDAARTSPERALLVADALLARSNAPGLSPFTDGIDKLADAERTKAEQAVRRKKDSRWTADRKGFSLNAGVSFSALDRRGREQLVRYCTRPPLAMERLSVLPVVGVDPDPDERGPPVDYDAVDPPAPEM